MKRQLLLPAASFGLMFASFLFTGCGGSGDSGANVTGQKVILGSLLFNDTRLSSPAGQACASCHQQSAGFSDPRQDSPTSEGVVAGLFGNRQAPTAKYMAFSPPFHFDDVEQDYIGGQFWDGRAADLAAQAGPPMLNPVEMNNSSKAEVVAKVMNSELKTTFQKVYGAGVFNDTDTAFAAITDAIAAFEKTKTFAPFSSKYDAFLAGRTSLTSAESRGLALYNGKAGCAACHPSSSAPGDLTPPLFTDFTYDNIGLPKNPNNKFYTDPIGVNPDGAAFVDLGLQNTTHRPEDAGRFKVATLRNIAVSGPYFHNGVVTTLEQAVQFYNKRDSGIFGPAEIPATQNNEELGNLGLTDAEVADIVAFLKTLTDGWHPGLP
jgi:cytochrome c peroxidase